MHLYENLCCILHNDRVQSSLFAIAMHWWWITSEFIFVQVNNLKCKCLLELLLLPQSKALVNLLLLQCSKWQLASILLFVNIYIYAIHTLYFNILSHIFCCSGYQQQLNLWTDGAGVMLRLFSLGKVYKSLDFCASWGSGNSKCKREQKVWQEFLGHPSFSGHADGWSIMKKDSSVDGQWQKEGPGSW